MNVLNFGRIKSLLAGLIAVLVLVPTAQAQTNASSAPFGSCPSENPSDQQKLTKYSLYYENYKNEDYKAALKHLRWMLRCAPAFGGRPGSKSAKNLRRAVETYSGLAEETQSEETARTYLDSALTVIDTAVPMLKEAGAEPDTFEWTFKRGYFIQSHGDLLNDRQNEAVESYRKAYDLSPEKLVGKDTTYYLNVIMGHYASQNDISQLLKLIQELQERYPESDQINELISKYIERVPPEERISFYEDRLEENPENLELVQTLFDLYRQQGMRSDMYELGERLREMEKSPEINRTLAQMYLDDGEEQKALELYKEIESMDADVTAQDYYNMGLALRDMGQLASARTHFRQALDVNPDFGRAYMAIGDLYVTAVSNCGSMDREDRAVYWLANDYYEKARSATDNSSVEQTATQNIQTYREYYPSKEDLFFWNKTEGDDYRVDSGCYSWINETTTVRNP